MRRSGRVRGYGAGMEIPRTQLRVFSPLESFPAADRDRWRAYVERGGGVTRRQLAALESGVARARLLSGRSRFGPDAALVRRVDGRIMLCPLQLELRAARALELFRRTVPPVAFEAFVPGRRVTSGTVGSVAVPHILDEAWSVPLSWFVAFAPSERRLLDPPEGASARIVYLTTCAAAAERIERVIRAVEDNTEDGEDVLATLADLAVWIDAFDPVSLLELDYGGVARILGLQELERDHTCADLWRAVDALEAGDPLAVAAAYGAAVARWRRHQARQYAS